METSFKNFLFNSWQSKQVFLKLSTVRAKQSPVLREGPQAPGLQGRTLPAPQKPNFLQQETLLGGHATGHSAWPGAALSCESCPPPGRIRQTEGAHHLRALCSGAPQTGVLVLVHPRIQSWVSGVWTTVAFSPSPQLLALGR